MPDGPDINERPVRRLRVALVYRHLHERGSVARLHTEVARYLVAREHEVHVLCARATSEPQLVPGATVHPVDCHVSDRLFDPRELWEFAIRSRPILRGLQCDVVYSRVPSTVDADIVYFPGVYLGEARRDGTSSARWAARLMRHPGQFSRAALEALSVRSPQSSIFHADSALVAADLRTIWGIPPEAVTLTTPGVDLARFRPREDRRQVRQSLGLSARDPIVLFCGHDFQRKGLDRAIAAIAGLDSVTLVVVGDGDIASFRALASRLGAESRVKFAGTTSSVEDYYAAADAVVLPSRLDMWGAPIIEAMASGVPIVASSAPGAASEIQSGVNGVIVPEPFSSESLARELTQLLGDDGGRDTMGKAGRETALRHSWANHGALVERDLHRVASVDRHRRSRGYAPSRRRAVAYLLGRAPLV